MKRTLQAYYITILTVGEQVRAFVTLLALLVSGGVVTGGAACALEPEIEAVLRGFFANARHFDQVTVESRSEEIRYVYDEDGSVREVSLFPQNLTFAARGEKFYYKHDGGGFSGVTFEATPGEYEGAYDGNRFIRLEHTWQTMNIFPDIQAVFVNPRWFVGWSDVERLSTSMRDTPERLAFLGMEELYGATCYIIEEKRNTQANRYWFDQSHGFLPRRMQVINDGSGKVVFEINLHEVFEVEPGVWAPRHASHESNHGNTSGAHFLRQVSFEKIDVSSTVPDETFNLTRPPNYYLRDYIVGAHFQPEHLQEDMMERQLFLPRDDADVTESANELHPNVDAGAVESQPEVRPDAGAAEVAVASRFPWVSASAVAAICVAGVAITVRQRKKNAAKMGMD